MDERNGLRMGAKAQVGCAVLVLTLVSAGSADTLILKKGDRITGRVYAANEQKIVFETRPGLAVTYPRADVQQVLFDNPKMTLEGGLGLDKSAGPRVAGLRAALSKGGNKETMKELTAIIEDYRAVGVLWSDVARDAALLRGKCLAERGNGWNAWFDLSYAKDALNSATRSEAARRLKDVTEPVIPGIAQDGDALYFAPETTLPDFNYVAVRRGSTAVLQSSDLATEAKVAQERRKYGPLKPALVIGVPPKDGDPALTCSIEIESAAKQQFAVGFRVEKAAGAYKLRWNGEPPAPADTAKREEVQRQTEARITQARQQAESERQQWEEHQRQATAERQRKEKAARLARSREVEARRRQMADWDGAMQVFASRPVMEGCQAMVAYLVAAPNGEHAAEAQDHLAGALEQLWSARVTELMANAKQAQELAEQATDLARRYRALGFGYERQAIEAYEQAKQYLQQRGNSLQELVDMGFTGDPDGHIPSAEPARVILYLRRYRDEPAFGRWMKQWINAQASKLARDLEP